LVIISMLLFGRNRATDAFQLVVGIFLSSSGAGKHIIDVFNHMGISVSYDTMQRCLTTLTEDARATAREFISSSENLWGLVYDNINFTLRKSSQRLDSATEQINATMSAIFSLPGKFTRALFGSALSRSERTKGGQKKMMIVDLKITTDEQRHLDKATKHQVRTLLLHYAPGFQKTKKSKNPEMKRIRKMVKKNKPQVRCLGHEQTQFFPLPALNEEEASVGGTIRVITTIFTTLLGLAEQVIDSQLRLIVGDWLTIRNLRLMVEERMDEFSSFARLDWVQEASMPFHFQLNAMYMLYHMHVGYVGDQDPTSLDAHCRILKRFKLDLRKPEYNKAKELVHHSLVARILDCARYLVSRFATTLAAQQALQVADDVCAHSILFVRDALLFEEFGDAIRDADVGRMWSVYRVWVFMMRGAGCHNYGNEILEMIAQFRYVLSVKLAEIVERTWLVNRWGKKGRSIPTDLYLEHNNGFIKVGGCIVSVSSSLT
ncbi:hypothetical protein OF83DRAFT_1069289, partial [Amylostereum chailletii]